MSTTFFCDTTVLFAASDAGHEHHRRSLTVVAKADPSIAFVAAHSLAELYATLSAAPPPKVRRLDQVLEAVDHAARVFTPVTLDLKDYLWVLRHAAERQARSGRIHDALILKCAERARVETVYTWNLRDFRSIAWPEVAERIRSP